MSRRLPLAAVRKIDDVQRARRFAAETAMLAARAEADRARHERGRAQTAASAAQAAWQDLLSAPHFVPEWSRALAMTVIARDADLASAANASVAAASHEAGREDERRAAQAQVRASEILVQRARRDALRERDERQLDALADRIASSWNMR